MSLGSYILHYLHYVYNTLVFYIINLLTKLHVDYSIVEILRLITYQRCIDIWMSKTIVICPVNAIFNNINIQFI